MRVLGLFQWVPVVQMVVRVVLVAFEADTTRRIRDCVFMVVTTLILQPITYISWVVDED